MRVRSPTDGYASCICCIHTLPLSVNAKHQMNCLMSERRGDFSWSHGPMRTDFICCPDLWAGVSAHGAEGGLLFIDVVFMRGRKRSLIEKLCSAPLYHIYSCSWNPPLSFAPTHLHISLVSSLFPFTLYYVKKWQRDWVIVAYINLGKRSTDLPICARARIVESRTYADESLVL